MAVLRNDSKKALFSVEERVEIVREVVQPFPNVEVESFDGLLVDYAAARGANLILRGIRAISDYEYELQMALMNRRLQPGTGDGVSDGGRGVLVPQFAPGKGSGFARRKCFGPGASGGGSPAKDQIWTVNKIMQTLQALAERISTISVSSTMKVAADAEKLRREGADVVDFGAGEPDFPTPANVKRAAIDAIDHNFTKYTNAAGTLELKQAICDRHKTDYGTAYAANECVVTVGGKHAIFNLMQALVEPGDEVIIPVPYWVTYKDVVNYSGGKCVFVDTDENEGFDLRASMIERALTPKTKMILLNSPSNPGGRGVRLERTRKDRRHGQGSRHLDPDRRVLPPLPV